MNIRFLFLFFMLVPLVLLSGSSREIKGKIVNSISLAPVEEAKIYHPSSGDSTFSDEDGEFSLTVPVGIKVNHIPCKADKTSNGFFDLKGQTITLKKLLPGNYIMRLNGKEIKVGLIRQEFTNRLLTPIRLAKRKTGDYLIISKEGYRTISIEIAGDGNMGEIFLPSEDAASVDVTITLDSLGTMKIETEIIMPDTGVVIIQ